MATSKVIDTAQIAFDSGLDLFSSPSCNLGLSDMREQEHKPQNLDYSKSRIVFDIPNGGDTYLYMPATRLNVKLRLVDKDGNALTAVDFDKIFKPKTEKKTTANAGATGAGEDADGVAKASQTEEDAEDEQDAVVGAMVGPISNLLHGLFDQVELFVGGHLITSGDTGYSHKAMMRTLLCTSKEVQDTRLQSALFYRDTPGAMNDPRLTPLGKNSGLKTRAKLTNGSRIVELSGFPEISFLRTPRYLLNEVPLKLTFHHTNSAFRLMSADVDADYRVEIVDISLFTTQVTPASQVLIAHQELLQSGKMARYYYVKQNLHQVCIPKGSTNFTQGAFFQSDVPDRMVFCFANTKALDGCYKLNPYKYDHYFLNYLNISVSGVPVHFGVKTPDFENCLTDGLYEHLFTADPRFDVSNDVVSPGITKEAFCNGSAIFSVDFNRATRQGAFYPTRQNGSVKFDLRFAKPLPHTVTMLVLAFTPEFVEIDQARAVNVTR